MSCHVPFHSIISSFHGFSTHPKLTLLSASLSPFSHLVFTHCRSVFYLLLIALCCVVLLHFLFFSFPSLPFRFLPISFHFIGLQWIALYDIHLHWIWFPHQSIHSHSVPFNSCTKAASGRHENSQPTENQNQRRNQHAMCVSWNDTVISWMIYQCPHLHKIIMTLSQDETSLVRNHGLWIEHPFSENRLFIEMSPHSHLITARRMSLWHRSGLHSKRPIVKWVALDESRQEVK
jgi:hypothetical protein